VTDVAEPLPGIDVGPRPNPGRGYLLYLVAATLFAINGTVAKSIMLTGIEPSRLSQLRVTAAFLVMLGALALTRPGTIRLRRAELPLLAVYGILGIATTQFLYFVSITRLPVGLALLIEFTSPIMVALWFHFGLRQATRRAVWAGLVLALTGLAIVAEVWQGFSLDVIGVTASFGAAASLAVYYVTAERQLHAARPRDPVSLTMWGMGMAALAWAVIQPWWWYPFGALGGSVDVMGAGIPAMPVWGLAAWMVVMGTVVPFSLVVLSMRHLRSSQASAMGMTEPIIATFVAWIALGEVLTPMQLAGSAIVLSGIFLAERNR
jgi:drug/metabolite transporter (DMT)-like permease